MIHTWVDTFQAAPIGEAIPAHCGESLGGQPGTLTRIVALFWHITIIHQNTTTVVELTEKRFSSKKSVTMNAMNRCFFWKSPVLYWWLKFKVRSQTASGRRCPEDFDSQTKTRLTTTTHKLGQGTQRWRAGKCWCHHWCFSLKLVYWLLSLKHDDCKNPQHGSALRHVFLETEQNQVHVQGPPFFWVCVYNK